MEDITFTVEISGTTRARLTDDQVLNAYHNLVKIGHDETEDSFYDLMLSWLEGDAEIEADIDIDECSISEWDREEIINFIKEVLKTDGLHIDYDGQTHLFDPEDYEVGEWELNRQHEQEIEELLNKKK